MTAKHVGYAGIAYYLWRMHIRTGSFSDTTVRADTVGASRVAQAAGIVGVYLVFIQ